MRRVTHNELSHAALYIAVPNATPVPVTVRVHRRSDFPNIGEASGYGGAAEMAVTEDRIRFQRDQLPDHLRINSVVSVEAGEAYRIEFWYPRDDEYVTARVTPLPEGEADGLPLPNG